MTVDKILRYINSGYRLNENQLDNLRLMGDISEVFAEKSGIGNEVFSYGSEDTIILESGHQPNFLPFPGVFKKAFLLGKIQKRLMDKGYNVCALFGFADLNLSTARLLYRNRIPEYNKNGNISIGFNIRKDEIWRSFNKINKPDYDVWLNELEKIKNHYKNEYVKVRSDLIDFRFIMGKLSDICEESYHNASCFSEVNSFLFAKICREIFGLGISFYSHSGLQEKNIFIDEWNKILAKRHEYNAFYNSTIKKYNLGLKSVERNSVPFWYNCKCGCKISLLTDEESKCEVKCPLCGTEEIISLSDLKRHFADMSLTAVTRDIVFSEGLGVSLFISGSGGSQKYGMISSNISDYLCFHNPVKLSWNSNDYYIGMTHLTALKDFMKKFHLETDDLRRGLLTGKTFSEISHVKQEIEGLSHENGGKNVIINALNRYNALKNALNSNKKIFSDHYSLLDILINENSKNIIGYWDYSLRNSAFYEDLQTGNLRIDGDVLYGSSKDLGTEFHDFSELYRCITSLEVV